MSHDITIAVPKGRILEELLPFFEKIDIIPEAEFCDPKSRKLSFFTNHKNIKIIRVRSFDIATFVSYGSVDIGIAGSDVLMEFDYPNIYCPVDLKIGKCRMALACPEEFAEDSFKNESHLRVATKYSNITKKYFAEKGIQAECIKLNGAMELAPNLNLCDYIVDLVSTGNTLKSNGLKVIDVIADISSRLIVNRSSAKTKSSVINEITEKFCAII